MLSISTSIALGFVFILLGGINVWLVLEAWTRVKTARTSSRMLTLHRIGGYLFIGLFFVMGYFMVARLRDGGPDTSPTVTIHLALAMVLFPLLFIKVLIARYYKNQLGLLMPIGLTIFVLAFVLIASTTGPYLARATKIEQVSIDPGNLPPVKIDLNQATDLVQKRCSKCHNLDRVMGARKDARGWLGTVSRMRSLPGAGISEADAQTIVAWLSSQNQPQGSEKAGQMEVARALVDQRCGRCHTLDRIYKTVQTPEQWRETVGRMVEYAAGSTGALQLGEDQQIIDYLSATQTPAAVNQRKAHAVTALLTGRSLTGQKAALNTPPSAPASRNNGETIAFISVVSLAVVMLILSRPGHRATAATKPTARLQTPVAAASRMSTNPFLLQLVQVTQQTLDTKTLRFAVNGSQKLDALPGQFLTFSFLFDGKKETRCYSICSSPARSGYLEITPKRLNNGSVSVFLNDRASIGMTVEATGPFGHFCLNPADRDKNLVLVAAGSGITPMMAMLRYIDDLCLETEVTLLYCVRTAQDIIFHQELDQLQMRLKNFQYHLLLSQPDQVWPGARGHISGEFIREVLHEIGGRVFFLCGPPLFMQAARDILTDSGVSPERIRQETFGRPSAELNPVESRADTGFTVAFARSRRTGAILGGQTLLQVAAENGIEIPSACRQGQCGTCKTRLLNGHVHMTAEYGLDVESKAEGFVLTCVGHAEGNVTLDA
jgi:ferredoxin-NADP reductase